MSRLTVKNVFKVAVAVVFFPFIAFLVLFIGIGAKNKKVLLEGATYATVFIAAVSFSGLGVAALAGLGSMAFSAVRAYMLRDLWLHRRVRRTKNGTPVRVYAPMQPPSQPSPVATSFTRPPDDLSASLAWVSSQAKQNKHRLPGDTYVTVLETCQMLDSVIDAESRQSSADARFEYELEATVREYLPAVLQGYLAIPPSMVESRQPNGRTPNEELVEQLRLLLGQAETLHSTRHSQTSADLTSTGNFLRERFGHHQQGGFDFGIK